MRICFNGRVRIIPISIASAFALLALALTIPQSSQASLGTPQRDSDPIVLRGSETPSLLGVEPDRIVAFSYDGGGWKQVPVQVDERALVNYSAVRDGAGNEFTHEAYTDPNTYAGADPDPDLDSDDELALAAKDAGEASGGASDPDGVVSGTRVRVRITDPLRAATDRSIYLFRSDGSLDPSAGKSYVSYDFSLNSGDYKSTYNFNGVPNVEDDAPPVNTESSTVSTSAYTQDLLSRWVTDGLTLKTGSSPSPDILDGDKAQVGRGCTRSELTFSRGGGGFIANKSGPIRAIRSFIGANSGTYTQRDEIYYQAEQQTATFLRVHSGVSQISVFRDYSPSANGMIYRNEAYPAGVTVDGSPDAAIPTPPGSSTLQPEADWEQLTGSMGTINTVGRVETTVPGFTLGSFYRDQGASPTFAQCGGYADYLSYGSSGLEFTSSGANTDPTLGSAYQLTSYRTTFFDPPNETVSDAALRSDQVDNPLAIVVSPEDADPLATLKLNLLGKRTKLKQGSFTKINLRLSNTSGVRADDLRLCATAPKKRARVSECDKIKRIEPSDSAKGVVKVKPLTRRPVKVKFKVSASNAETVRLSKKLKVRSH